MYFSILQLGDMLSCVPVGLQDSAASVTHGWFDTEDIQNGRATKEDLLRLFTKTPAERAPVSSASSLGPASAPGNNPDSVSTTRDGIRGLSREVDRVETREHRDNVIVRLTLKPETVESSWASIFSCVQEQPSSSSSTVMARRGDRDCDEVIFDQIVDTCDGAVKKAMANSKLNPVTGGFKMFEMDDPAKKEKRVEKVDGWNVWT